MPFSCQRHSSSPGRGSGPRLGADSGGRPKKIQLVGASPTPEKSEFVSWDDDIHNILKKCSKSPTKQVFFVFRTSFCENGVWQDPNARKTQKWMET
jgi:hypothetical protein